jgi:hypothetical protein
LNARIVVALSVVVIVLIGAAFLVNMQQAATTSTESRSSSSTSTSTGGSYVNSPQNLQLRLSVDASATRSPAGGVAVNMTVSEYNTLASANNVSMGRQWNLTGLSLGPCGTEAYPFGVSLYRGSYTAGNVSAAQQIRIYPAVPCPLLIRYITGYLFQPMSNLAVVLPGGPNATATQMAANVTATMQYGGGASYSSSTPLGPGTYTAAAGDEWGSVVLVHFTVGAGGSTSSASTSTSSTTTSTSSSSTIMETGSMGMLEAGFSVGPTQPVCSVNSTVGPAPSQYSSIKAVVTPQPSGQAVTLPISWRSNGCSVSGSLEAPLAPGTYSLSLSSCQWMGCAAALPKGLVVISGQSTSIVVSIDTGIR